ncbi:hypothetical protein BDV38DRAFT_293923 [Aspergillus pseudotamarii]|uniref:Zn(2)-C6 fungal-type domain-containing protein n=1 Tax=Aspergillus pseudotamarii TaxID=132259 RepID=A0A5N6SSZ1_ASPPS|nr:uncharacterized protein BDV38DRAFT_293923 [Aspergillus pseudotamarii]KAE8136513.1 hypothetical protein BDV38DRAFT_293923 [Aspergillus pseudotamarii]
MRTTLACQWCRKSKVKCHHDGIPPCKSCRAHPGRECSLSTPTFRRKRRMSSHSPANTARANRVSKTIIGEISTSRRIEKTNAGLQNQQSPTAFSTHTAVSDANSSCERQGNASLKQPKTLVLPENALDNVDRELVIRASRIFVQQFPEFGFVHKPTFFEYGLPDEIPVIKLCAILALCARYIPELVDQYGSPYLASQYFASVVRENIMSYVAQHPGIDAVHAMILLSLYDWGEGNGFQAWIYTDLEARGVQFQTPFTAFCMFSAASTVLYADTWPYMAPELENAKKKYTWSFDWLGTASERWEIAKCWYETLGELMGIFTRLKTDGHNFPHLGREQFQDLHDNLHRLAEPESSTVNALAALSQHASPDFAGPSCQSHPGTTRNGRDLGPQPLVTQDTVRLQEVHNTATGQSQAGLLGLDHEPQAMDDNPGIDTDFLMAMLSDPSGDWSHVI